MNNVTVSINIDFELLRRQKEVIQVQISDYPPGDSDLLEGILCLIDHIQDTAVDSCRYTEEEVFGNLETQ